MKIQTTDRDKKIAKASHFTSEQVAIIKNTVAKGVTDTELAFFLNVAKSNNLNPFNKEIWCYKDNKGNVIIFAGRDGFLKTAQTSGRWNGIASCEVREKDKFSVDIPKGIVNHETGFGDRGGIIGAYAICKPKGCEISTIELADFATYNKGYNVWKSHPADMIKKVAEIKALKKAYGITGLQDEDDFNVIHDRVYAIDTEERPGMQKIAFVEGLINSAAINDEVKEKLLAEVIDRNVTNSRLDDIADDMHNCQPEPIDKVNPSQGDIQKQLDLVMNNPRK